MNIVESHVREGSKRTSNRRDIFEECECFLDRHLEHIRDALAAIANGEGLAVIPPAETDLTRHEGIGQKLHLDADRAIALARFASPALHVEGETPAIPAPHTRFGDLGEKLADARESAAVGGGVAPRAASDRTLIDIDDFVDVFDSRDRTVGARLDQGTMERGRQDAMQRVIDQGRLSASRDTTDDGEATEGNLEIDVFQVIRAAALDSNDIRGGGFPA